MRQWIADLVVLAVAAYLQAASLVRCSAALLEKVPPLPPPPASVAAPERAARGQGADVILSRNPFDSSFGSSGRCPELALAALAESDDRSWSLATLRTPGGPRRVRVGTRLDEHVVVSVGSKVWLKGPRGVCRVGWGRPTEPASAPDGADGALSVLDRSAVLADPRSFLAGASVVREGDAYRLRAIAPGSPLARLGARAGDRVLSVEGHAIARPHDALRAWARLRDAERLRVRLEREGRLLDVDVWIR